MHDVAACLAVVALLVVTPGVAALVRASATALPSRSSPVLPALSTWAAGEAVPLAFALVVSRAGDLLRRPRVKIALDRLTGCVLVGLGVRLAIEKR